MSELDLPTRISSILADISSKPVLTAMAPEMVWHTPEEVVAVLAEAQTRIKTLELENAELRADVEILSGHLTAAIEDYNDGRSETLEEAAKVVENIAHDGLHGSMWEQKFRAAAAAILALSVPSPTPLQEQNANSGKEWE